MISQITAKKQTVVILEQELEAQEKRLNLLIGITEKNNVISYVVFY